MREIEANGLYYISADQIREVKEPRLMTKFDTRESLPSVFGGRLGILPVTRGSYVIGEFELYEDFPETKNEIKQITSVKIPDYLETIDVHDIRSEANAIGVMEISGILDHFLNEKNLIQTISGRMGSGTFSFSVSGNHGKGSSRIEVRNSQLEIDGGFENERIVTLIEAKNVIHSNFLIRQLYYPFRLWETKISKPIRPVFMVYSNNIFRLLEYEFTDSGIYNSIRLVREQSYSLEDTKITARDLKELYDSVKTEPEPAVTFIQADSFEKVISLVEHLAENPMSAGDIAELFGFRERQSDYYYNACKYLGLAEKSRAGGGVRVHITELGKKLLKMRYKERQYAYVTLILKHQIFHEMFQVVLETGQIPDKHYIAGRMRELNICGEGLLLRRASSVRGWLDWIWSLSR